MHKILITDDDPRMRRMMRQFVEDLASEVLEAGDGAEAMALYATQRPDWVLMDWRMKPLDGLRATALIKAQFPQARIVIVSEYDEPEVQTAAACAGACAFVPKDDLRRLLGILTGACAQAKCGSGGDGPA
jgi:CheY-like chemotaxis protein